MVSPVKALLTGLIEYETKPSPLLVTESLTSKNPSVASWGANPVLGSSDWKIQKAS